MSIGVVRSIRRDDSHSGVTITVEKCHLPITGVTEAIATVARDAAYQPEVGERVRILTGPESDPATSRVEREP